MLHHLKTLEISTFKGFFFSSFFTAYGPVWACMGLYGVAKSVAKNKRTPDLSGAKLKKGGEKFPGRATRSV